jgi:hypothetical protein
VIAMKAAVLHTQGIDFTPWGIAVVKAAVLAKFMMLGGAMKIGERKTTSPLIWPTLRRAFAFLMLLIIPTIIEEARKPSSACSTTGRLLLRLASS